MTTDPPENPHIRDIPAGEVRTGSTRGEAFRAVMRLRTPEGETATVIVTSSSHTAQVSGVTMIRCIEPGSPPP